MGNPIIHVENLGKLYTIGERQVDRGLRHVLDRVVSAPFRLFKGRNGASSNGDPTKIWALKDVSFDIQQGDVVGIIGRNGAGKTTLLKILARVTKPTTGFADVHGRMGSLLEVGTGFHPELTGRENTFLNGAILGMSKKEIERKFDEIVAFAEIEKFIDTPVKHYSSGMQVRLAFSVAAHLEPEILLVDEVLSVGDIQFQKKCMGKMGNVAKEGRTIIFVSHQMNQIRRLCQRAIWMENGGVREEGRTGPVLGRYEALMTINDSAGVRRLGSETRRAAHFVFWEIVDPRSEGPNILSSGSRVMVRFVVQSTEPLRIRHHSVHLYNSDSQIMWGTANDDFELGVGTHSLVYSLPNLPLRPGAYYWRVTLYDEKGAIDVWECSPQLIVSTDPVTHPMDEWTGVLNIPSQFQIQPTSPEDGDDKTRWDSSAIPAHR